MSEPGATWTDPRGEQVVVVIVTHNRAESLARSLAAIAAQQRRPDHLIVVDNAAQDAARQVVDDCPIPSTYLPSLHNLGGAGGFAFGMLAALAHGADLIWLADDDGRPADDTVLGTLVECLHQRSLAEVSPAVVDEADPSRLAFRVRRGLSWKRRIEEFDGDFEPGISALFNGALFTASALAAVGVPDSRLFMRGDEVEIHRRLVRSGLPFGTCLTARYLHPYGVSEWKPMLGGKLAAQDPDDDAKRYYTYRNRGYLMAQPGLRWLRPLETVRYGWYFLVDQRSPAGFATWRRLTRQGRREHFVPDEQFARTAGRGRCRSR